MITVLRIIAQLGSSQLHEIDHIWLCCYAAGASQTDSFDITCASLLSATPGTRQWTQELSIETY